MPAAILSDCVSQFLDVRDLTSVFLQPFLLKSVFKKRKERELLFFYFYTNY